MECPFCDPAILQKQCFFDRGRFLALYSIKPFLPGHSLVVPKRHITSLNDASTDEKAELVDFINDTASIALRYAGAHDYDLNMQQGEVAGREVEHAHIHIIPRREDDVFSRARIDWFIKFVERGKYRDEYSTNLTDQQVSEIVKEMKTVAGMSHNKSGLDKNYKPI